MTIEQELWTCPMCQGKGWLVDEKHPEDGDICDVCEATGTVEDSGE